MKVLTVLIEKQKVFKYEQGEKNSLVAETEAVIINLKETTLFNETGKDINDAREKNAS